MTREQDIKNMLKNLREMYVDLASTQTSITATEYGRVLYKTGKGSESHKNSCERLLQRINDLQETV